MFEKHGVYGICCILEVLPQTKILVRDITNNNRYILYHSCYCYFYISLINQLYVIFNLNVLQITIDKMW